VQAFLDLSFLHFLFHLRTLGGLAERSSQDPQLVRTTLGWFKASAAAAHRQGKASKRAGESSLWRVQDRPFSVYHGHPNSIRACLVQPLSPVRPLPVNTHPSSSLSPPVQPSSLSSPIQPTNQPIPPPHSHATNITNANAIPHARL
jgi:hypothetical protein